MAIPSLRWTAVCLLHMILLGIANYKRKGISYLTVEDDQVVIESVENEIKSIVDNELLKVDFKDKNQPIIMQQTSGSTSSEENEELRKALQEMDKLRKEISSIRTEYDKRLHAMQQEIAQAKKQRDEEENIESEDDDDEAEQQHNENEEHKESIKNKNIDEKRKAEELLNQSILKLKAPQGLTRMSTRGVDFVDEWRQIPYKFTEKEMQVIYDGFGADDLDPKNCTTRSQKRKAIAGRLAYHGLGMNLIQLANYIMYASHHPQGFFFVFLPFTFFNLATKKDSHPFQVWFEQKFVMASEADSYCDIFAERCDKVEGRCYDVWWENPETNPKLYYW